MDQHFTRHDPTSRKLGPRFKAESGIGGTEGFMSFSLGESEGHQATDFRSKLIKPVQSARLKLVLLTSERSSW